MAFTWSATPRVSSVSRNRAPPRHGWAIRLRDRRGMTADSDSASGHRTWRFAGIYADRTASGFACGMSA